MECLIAYLVYKYIGQKLFKNPKIVLTLSLYDLVQSKTFTAFLFGHVCNKVWLCM